MSNVLRTREDIEKYLISKLINEGKKLTANRYYSE